MAAGGYGRFLPCTLLICHLLLPVHAETAADSESCSVDAWRPPWEAPELPWVLYVDQNCPSERGIVEDSAIWEGVVDPVAVALANVTDSEEFATHDANKMIGSLRRPVGLRVAGGSLMWLEQDAGTLRRCRVVPATGRCAHEPTIMLDGLNCPKDLALDYINGHVYVIQFGGGDAEDASISCRGEGRITRFDLGLAADGSSHPLDVVRGLTDPTYLAVDALHPSGRPGRADGSIFWTDPEAEGGVLMRTDLDGGHIRKLLHLLLISGLAVDTGRQAIYVTQQARGASVTYSSYDGLWQKPMGSARFFKPRALAVDPTDGALAVVEFDTFDRGSDPLAQGGYGAVTALERNLGRISRISCAWRADATVDGRVPSPSQCCCHVPGPNHWGCTLDCSPPGPPPPSMPPPAPATPPGEVWNGTILYPPPRHIQDEYKEPTFAVVCG